MKSEAVSISHTLLQQLLNPHYPLPSGGVQLVVASDPGSLQREGRAAWLPATGGQTGPEAFLDVPCLVSSRLCMRGGVRGAPEGCLFMNPWGLLRSPGRSVRLHEHFQLEDLLCSPAGLARGFVTLSGPLRRSRTSTDLGLNLRAHARSRPL